MTYSDSDCIEALIEASRMVDGNLTYLDYKSIDIKPSAGTIEGHFGSWNEGKRAAGLKTVDPPYKGSSHSFREVSDKYKIPRDWYIEIKEERVCEECSETDPRALQFHHLDSSTKNGTISLMVRDGAPMEDIKEEYKKCVILCANCHRKEHQSWPPTRGGYQH